MKYIIKFFPEIMVKGTVARKKMVIQLNENLIRLLKRVDESVETKRFWDKIEVQSPDAFAEKVKNVLLNTPGIEQVYEAVQYDFETMQDIAEKVALHTLPLIEGKTFVARCKRKGQQTFTSFDVERFVGEYLFENGNPAGVDLRKPEVMVKFELDEKWLNIVLKRHIGQGGFPLGTQGEALSLMSGGFDSTVASYLSMKRGIKTHFIFFNLGGGAHELGVKQVALYLWAKFGASHRVKIVSIPFEDVVAEILKGHESYMGITLKRLMLIAAEKVATDMNIDALITGESVAQVSSQTLRNLALIDEATNMLVLRPLAMMNKPDIMALADDIGTRHFSENMPEYCGVISKNPAIHGSRKRMAKEKQRFDYTLLDVAIEKAVTLPVDTIVEEVNSTQAIEVVTNLKDEVVIDIRSEQEVIANPLDLSDHQNQVIAIPFHLINRQFKNLEQSKSYVLYCEKGVMSQLHAHYIQDNGFNNIKVFRPENPKN